MSTILIAEDDKITMLIYKKIISYLGHDIIACQNGKEAVDALKNRNVDLVILDYMMPEMDGLEACAEIRKLPNGISIPVIIVSANDSQDEILNCLNAGANDYLIKPIKEPILIAKLKNFLKTSSLHKNEIEIVKNKVAIADKYKVVKILGYGTHSIVFLAENMTDNNSKVAVKLLNQNVLTEELANSFIELATQITNTNLTNVIKILDYGLYNGHIFIVLEYASGGDFASRLKQTENLDEAEVVRMMLEINQAFIDMEQNNITHLDIKPENILISEDGTHKLTDFGIIKEETNATMSIKSEIWSTAAYAPPEIFLEQNKINIKSDIYSLGVTAYQAITGDNPFFAEKAKVAMFRQINLQPTSILELDTQCSVELSLLIDMMLAKDLEQRPSTIEIDETLSYIHSCFQNGRIEELTYIEKTDPTQQQTPELEEKKTQDIERAASKIKAKNKTLINNKSSVKTKKKRVQHIKKTKKPILESIPLLGEFLKFFIPLSVGIILYFAAGFVYSMIEKKPPEFDFKGLKSAVECSNCGNIDIKEVINIKQCKCPKCGGQEWFAYTCGNCHKIFPWDEDEIVKEEEKLEQAGADDAMFEDLYVCPYCKSADIYVLPWEQATHKEHGQRTLKER